MASTWTWGQIKSTLTGITPQAMSGKIVEKDSGTPTELELYARITMNEIAGNSHKFSWVLREHTLTLTSATSYDLLNEIADFTQIYQIHGDSLPNNESPYQPLKEFNVDSGGVKFTIQGRNLLFANPPTAGSTVKIPYYSNFLVIDKDDSSRKMDFEDDDDRTIIPDEHIPMLTEGIMRFIQRKMNAGKKDAREYTRRVMTWDGRVVDIDPGYYHMQEAIRADTPVDMPVRDLRDYPVGA